ncbi:MAG: DUF924 family protein [Burkholderiaceae bacterium]
MSASDVLSFWFGEPDSPDYLQPRELWFTKSDATDRRIANQFGPVVERALHGEHDDWAATTRGALALVVLLDQFPRNMFRGTPRAFAGDSRALALAMRLVDTSRDMTLAPVERWFVYMPLEHSEQLLDQYESVRLFERLAADGLDAPLDWARRHFEVVKRFGRFPHRNAILGRESTSDEFAFLKQPGSGF